MESDLELTPAEPGDIDRALTEILRMLFVRILDDLPPDALRLIRAQCAAGKIQTQAETQLLREIDVRLRAEAPRQG
jgi:hypothetical protein